MGNGAASDRIVRSLATTSISPVDRSGFSLPAGRAATTPVTRTQNSLRSACACSSRKTTCTMPDASLRSTKITPPWSRRRATQPASVTVVPACDARNMPASCERIKVELPRISAILDVCGGYGLDRRPRSRHDQLTARDHSPLLVVVDTAGRHVQEHRADVLDGTGRLDVAVDRLHRALEDLRLLLLPVRHHAEVHRALRILGRRELLGQLRGGDRVGV